MWGIFGQIEFYKMQRFWFFPDPYMFITRVTQIFNVHIHITNVFISL